MLCNHLQSHDVYTCLFLNKELYSIFITELWRSPNLSSDHDIFWLYKHLSQSNHLLCYKIKELHFKCIPRDDHLLDILPLTTKVEKIVIEQAFKLTDRALGYISQHCKQLKHIELQNNKSFTDASTIALGQCPQLSTVKLDQCFGLSSRAIEHLVHLPITHLTMSFTNESAYQVRSLTRLRYLYVTQESSISRWFFVHLILDRATGLPYLPNLETLCFGGGLTDPDAVIPFMDTHPSITGLQMDGELTDQVFETISILLLHLNKTDCWYPLFKKNSCILKKKKSLVISNAL